MASWKKVIVSGSAADLASLTLDTGLANSELANSSVSFGGVSVALGASDSTPAFDLQHATALPAAQLTAGTLAAHTATNLVGTAAGLTVGATTGVEAGADVTDTANVTSAGALMDSECTDLAAVKATEDPFTAALLSKLNAVEASADVTDTTNVTAAGALMDSEVDADIKTLSLPASTTISTFGASLIDDAAASNSRTTLGLGTAATTAATDYATAAQGTKADAALPKAGGAMTGNITTNGLFDGVDIATRDGVLSSTTTTANAALPKAGGAMTGNITTNGLFDGVDIATRDGILSSTTTTANAALPKSGGEITGNITCAGDELFDGRNLGVDGAALDTAVTKLSGIEASATADQTGAEIATALNSDLGGNVAIGNQTSDTVTFAGPVVVTGDLTVNGTTTTVATTNLSVKDQFVTIASGSTGNVDGGIIVSKQADGAGYALGYEATAARWVLDDNLAIDATAITPDAYVGIVTFDTSVGSGTPTYGGSSYGYGNMHVETDTGDIFIYS